MIAASVGDAESKSQMAISAQTVNYNIPDFNGQNLKLDGPALAGIYSGKIQSWDDPTIAAMNAAIIAR